MTLIEERPLPPAAEDSRGPADNGGVAARRAVVRWAWRLVRREWRAQALVLALLTSAVAAAIGGAAAAYNLTPAAGDATFGTANHSLEYEAPPADELQADLTAATAWFGAVDLISRRFMPIPGLFDGLELRAQAPASTYGAPMLDLVDGRYPTAAGELAITDGVGDLVDVGADGTVTLGGETWSVVGTVENPSNLDDEFGLVAPAHLGNPEVVTMLIGGTDERFEAFRPPSGAATSGAGRGANEAAIAAATVLVASTIVLLLVALIAAAGFVVVARRRLRQLGMLAAIGATERHLRLVMVANGAVVGALAAVLGAVIALVAWVTTVPFLEGAVGHRIATFDIPWWLVGSGMLLAILSSTVAAWWPARAIARTPIVAALSGRPDRPRSSQRSAALATLLTAGGAACLGFAGDPAVSWTSIGLIVGGTAALTFGVLNFSPLAIRALARLRGPAPVAVRLALSDLVRYQTRSGAALAAISLALGMATVVTVAASAAVYGAATEGNLSDHQLMIRIGAIPGQGDVTPVDERTPAEIERLDAAVDEIAAPIAATLINVDVVVAPDLEGFEGVPAVVLGTPVEETGPGTSFRILSNVYVATPALLAKHGVDEAAIDPEADVVTTQTAELWLLPERDERVNIAQPLDPTYTSLPGSFMTAEAVADRGWTTARSGWLVESATALTDEQIADVRTAASAAGVTLEVRHNQGNLATLRNAATGVGVLVALAIMAMMVGLIRSESTGDLRILTAAGATSGNRRMLTAATAGGLAVLGALLGLAGAYLGLGAAHFGDLAALTPVPVVHLLIIAVGLPTLAAVAGWVLAGRDPARVSRAQLD